MLGIVMLFGLVAKNGILLVDYSNTLVGRGMRVHDAVLQAAATRFRPIVMTTAAMIFGMLPLALGYAEGGEWRQAMGTVIIGGLLSSLVLTLFLVPMIYELVDRLLRTPRRPAGDRCRDEAAGTSPGLGNAGSRPGDSPGRVLAASKRG